jgi:hypothetical protein
MKVWITGQVIDQELNQWYFGGVYSNKQNAIDNCFNDDWFVAEVEIDKASINHEIVYFDHAWYPTCEDEPES